MASGPRRTQKNPNPNSQGKPIRGYLQISRYTALTSPNNLQQLDYMKTSPLKMSYSREDDRGRKN